MAGFSFRLAFFSAVYAGVVLGAFNLSNIPRETNLRIVKDAFLVELSNINDFPSKRDFSAHGVLYEELMRRAVGFNVRKEFNHADLFVGVALTLDNAQDAQKLSGLPGVVAIRPIQQFSPPKPVFSHVVTGPDDPALPPDVESTHIITGVDKLHAQGITGKGIKIGILDTGIDYTHPALGGGFGPGHKVIGGFDLVGDAYDGTNTPMPDPDPLDQCNGHGTHVAGIIGADPNANSFNISGVAFDASLSSYRIFGCTGFVNDDVIVDALLRGVSDGQDILTLSLGGVDGWTESTSSVVSSRIAASGKVVTIAAGNEGSSGSWFTSSPGNGINVISVASLDNTVIPLQSAQVGGVTHDPIPYFELFPFNVTGPLPIFATSNDTTIADDACNALPDTTPDLSKFVTIVRRGTCTFVQKLTNVAAKGAQIVLIYDNGTGFVTIDTGNFTTASLIQAADGQFLVQNFANGIPVTLTFPQTGGLVQLPDPAGGLISSFSSFGPTNDFFFKPAVAAPGGNILSTLPIPLGSFGIESGTSMATPFVAGSAALILSAKGKSKAVATSIRTLLETTANTISSSHTDGDPLQTVTQQGAGLVNVFNAVHSTTTISKGELLLNDTANFKSVQTFTVTNNANSVKQFKLHDIPAGTAITIQPGTIFPATAPVPLTTDRASVSISPSSFSLSPGRSQVVTVVITPPKNLDTKTLPVFSGFIHIVSDTEDLHVTYLGADGALKDRQVIDNTDTVLGAQLPLIMDSEGNIVSSPTNFTFVGSDFPSLVFRLAFGSPLVRLDLVDANIKFTPTFERRALPGQGFTFPHKPSGTFAKVPTLGSLAELDFQSRNDLDSDPFNTLSLTTPTFANGTTIPNGSFRFLLRALQVTGDPTQEADFESWLSPIIGVAVPGP